MRTQEYLDKAKVSLGLQSDYALAKALKVTQPAISNYRAGRTFDDDVALKVAEILKIQPLEVIAVANLERAKTEETRAMWKDLLEKISKGFDDLLSGANPHGGRIPVC